MSGKLADELAAIRERAEQITETHPIEDCDLDGETCTGHDAQRLVAALEAVLALHHPEDRGRVLPCCAFCCTEDECVAWPDCPEVEAITRALTDAQP